MVYSLNFGEDDQEEENQKKDLSLWEIFDFTYAKFGEVKKQHPYRDAHLLKMHFLPYLLVEILPFLYQVSSSISLSVPTPSAIILTFFDPLAHLHFYYYSYVLFYNYYSTCMSCQLHCESHESKDRLSQVDCFCLSYRILLWLVLYKSISSNQGNIQSSMCSRVYIDV